MNKAVSIELDRLLLEKNIPIPVKTTIEDVITWIYKKYNIWIWVSCKEVEDGSGNILFVANGRKIPFEKDEGFVKDCIIYNPKKSPTEAYEFAIEYCLTKLI